LGFWKPLEGARATVLVNVAERDDVAVVSCLLGVAAAFAADADAGDVDFFIGRLALGRRDPAGDPKADAGHSALFQKIAAIGPAFHEVTPRMKESQMDRDQAG